MLAINSLMPSFHASYTHLHITGYQKIYLFNVVASVYVLQRAWVSPILTRIFRILAIYEVWKYRRNISAMFGLISIRNISLSSRDVVGLSNFQNIRILSNIIFYTHGQLASCAWWLRLKWLCLSWQSCYVWWSRHAPHSWSHGHPGSTRDVTSSRWC